MAELLGEPRTGEILEIGCGAGRLPIGLLEEVGELRRYEGIDVRAEVIAWCNRQITRRDPRFGFTHVDVSHSRYNPTGSISDTGHRLPFEDASFDLVYAYSVLSHMEGATVSANLREISRCLRPAGAAYLTAFVEDDVPREAVNPPDYGPMSWQGALHCVRFERSWFDRALASADLELREFRHGTETDGQSLYVVRRRPDESPAS